MKHPFANRILVRSGLCMAVLLLLFIQPAFSESIEEQIIKGRVIDSAVNSPLPYSTVVLFSSDSVFIAGTITNEQGAFEFGKLKPGSYKVVVKFLGYDTKTVDQLELPKGQSGINLGDIAITPATSELNEVTVTRKKAQVENHPDKNVINIRQGGITEGGVIADALVQVPSVTLDANRNVLLRGSNQFKVLIDGVPSPLDGNEALKGIAVANIEKIEVITNPSSSYDSEGSAGIINIVLKKEKTASIASQINLNASSNGSRNENISLMGQGKKLNFNLSFDDRLHKENSTSDITSEQLDAGITDRLSSTYDYQLSMQMAKADATYQINSANSIQGLFWLLWADSDQTTEDAVSASSPAGSKIISGRNNKVFMPQLRYNHKFKKEGSLITFFAQYNEGSENSEQKVAQFNQDQFHVNMDIPYRFLMLREDMTLVLNKNLTFLSGLDYKYSGFDYLYNYAQANSGSWIKDEAKSHESSFRSDIAAAYLQLNGNTPGFGFQAGIRAENTDRALSDEQDQEIFNYQKLSLFPSIQINRKLSENNSFGISYSRRLNRPRLYQLNPFRNYSNPGYVSSGNYQLVSEYQNTIELTVMQRAGMFSFNGTLYGKFTKDPIVQTSSSRQDTVFFSYQNADKDQRLGGELSFSWNPAEWFSGTLTGNLFNYQLETNDASAKRENTQYETSLNLTVNPVKSLSIQSFSTLKSKNITLQGYIKGYFTSDLAISKQFWNNRLRASIKVTDLFDGVEEDETIETGTTRWNRYYKPDSRQVIGSVTFNINRFTRKSTPAPEATPY